MKKFTTLFSLLALAGGSMFAADLGEATVIAPETAPYITWPDITLTWDSQGIEAVDANNLYVEVSYNGGEPTKVEATLAAGGGPTDDATNKFLDVNFSELAMDMETYEAYFGTYTITIPEGIVQALDGGETNEGQKIDLYYFQPVSDDYATVTPAGGWETTVTPESLNKITISWEGLPTITYLNTEPATWTIMATEQEIDLEFGTQVTIEDENTLVITLGEDVEDGSYQLYIPATYVKIGDDKVNSSIYVQYMVFDGMQSATVILPEESMRFTSFAVPVYLTWDYQPITVTEEGLRAMILVNHEDVIHLPAEAFELAYIDEPTGEGGEPDFGLSTLAEGDEVNNVLIIHVAEYLPEGVTGNIQISLASGSVENEAGLVNPEQTVSYDIYPIYPTEATFTVEEALITVTWEGAEFVNPGQTEGAFIESDERYELDYDSFGWGWGEITSNDDYTGLNIDLSEKELPDGEYLLVLPEAYVLIEADEATYISNEATYELTIENGLLSGVKIVGAEVFDGVYRVYNLQGLKVLETTDASQLNNLKGLYIINGKKAIIK